MGFLSGIFGGSAPAPTPNFSGASNYLSALGQIGQNQSNSANQATQTFNADQTQNQGALNAYSQYLQSNPATQSYDAGQVANAENGASEGAARATANTEQALAQKGIAPNSGITAGAIAGINQGLASNDARIQSDVGQQNIAQHAQNLGTLANLWSGQAGTAFGQQQSANSGAAGVNTDAANIADQQAITQYNAAQANYTNNQNNTNDLMGAVGSFLPGIGGGSTKALLGSVGNLL